MYITSVFCYAKYDGYLRESSDSISYNERILTAKASQAMMGSDPGVGCERCR